MIIYHEQDCKIIIYHKQENYLTQHFRDHVVSPTIR